MSNKNAPLISLDPAGKAPIISYNVPEPTAYHGRSFIELDFGENNDGYFLPIAFEKPIETESPTSPSTTTPPRGLPAVSTEMAQPLDQKPRPEITLPDKLSDIKDRLDTGVSQPLSDEERWTK